MIDPEKFKIDPKKASADDIRAALALLEKKRVHDAKVEAGEIKGYAGTSWKDMSPAAKEKAKLYAKRIAIKTSLIIAKAVAAGITISEKEIEAEMAKRTKKAA